jgi:hypothetical protein
MNIMYSIGGSEIKKILSIVIIILIISSYSNISIGESSNNIIYVDDDGGADYTRIQDAIDNASDGDTVFVYERDYYENLIVDKSINLIGDIRNSTIIHGNNNSIEPIAIIMIEANYVSISGFTLLTEHNFRGIQIHGKSSNFQTDIKISNNSIIRPFTGESVSIFYGMNITISENILCGVFGAGYSINITSYNNDIHGRLIECVMAYVVHFIENNIYLDYPNIPMVKYLIFNSWEVIKYPWVNVKFKNNYYGRAILLPKPIIYLVDYPIPNTHPQLSIIFPWILLDWNPGSKPYDILE